VRRSGSDNGLRHRGPIAGIAAHGHYVATAGYDNRVILWDARSHRALSRGHHDHLVNQCAFSADGHWLLTASSDYSARVWAVPSMRLHAVLGGHTDDVDMAVFSPDDRRIATCALDRSVRIFDLTGRCLQEMRGHTGNVLSLVWSQDARHVISSSVDGSVRRWDADRGVEVQSTELNVRTDSIEIDSDGVVYAGDDLGRIAVIDQGAARFIQAHRAGVKKIALDAQHGILVSLSYDCTLAVWRVDKSTGLKEVSRSPLPETVWARTAAVLDDGRIAAGTFGSSYAVFDPRSNTWDLDGIEVGPGINAVLQVADHVYTVGDAGCVAIDGRPAAQMGSLCNFLVEAHGQVLTGGQLGRLFDARTGAVIHTHHSPLNCGVAFERRGLRCLAVGTYTGEVLIFEPGHDDQLTLVECLAIYQNAVKGLSVSGGLLFSVCASTDVAWHRLDDWSVVRRVTRAHERIANACCDIGSGRFASVGRDRTLRLWDGSETEGFPSPHPHSVKCMAVDDARTAILTGCYGGTVARFDLKSKQWTNVQRPTDSGISSITWDRRHGWFLAASYDGGIYPVAA